MPIMFNMVLREAGFSLRDVRLLRHKDKRAERGRTPYELWRDNRAQFDAYQATQEIYQRAKLQAPYWASFVGTSSGETMFVGLYGVRYKGLLQKDTPWVHADGIDKAGSCDSYELTLMDALSDLAGKLFIDWGPAGRAWIQRADKQDKRITEVRMEFKEPDFPGFLEFMKPLSKIEELPTSWVTVLKSSKGVYLLTCPKTKEQYVGSATGHDGFWGRWQEYACTGHGGNVGLKRRKPSDYQVSILEVAGSAASEEDILQMEGRWQRKLQSREMGLNRNLARNH